MENALLFTVDVENLYQTKFAQEAVKKGVNSDVFTLEIERPLNKLLDIFENYNVQATFFVLGDFAESNPAMVEKIYSKGHEIESHSQKHPDFKAIKEEEIQKELKDSKKSIENITKSKVFGLRVPVFSFYDTLYDIMEKEGYKYSSSVMPSINIPGFYGGSGEPGYISKKGNITEIPLSVDPLFKTPIGGAWIRLLGVSWMINSIKRTINRKKYAIIYLHPWEGVNLDTDTTPWRMRFRTGDYYLKAVEKITRKFKKYKFITMSDFLEEFN